jgi:alpha-1,2-mannosyltransferase
MMTRERRSRLGRAALPILAILSFTLGVGAVIAAAGDTLGYDFVAYRNAADRLLTGRPIYDPTVDIAGPFAVFLYPPPFAVAFAPFALVPSSIGVWTWIAGCVAMTLAAIAIMPVSPSVRWAVILLAGIDWPVAYSIKLGQVGPLLLLVFAIGWRLLRSETALGLVGTVGALVKVQPALLFGWAFLSGRWRMIAAGLAAAALVTIVTLPIVGFEAWGDYVQTIGRVSAPVTTPHTMTVGAIAYQAGATETLATGVQVIAIVVTVAIWIFASRWRAADVGYVTTIVASQLLSPLLWDHYAILLLLPVAWLIHRGHHWAVAIPLTTSIPLLFVAPVVVYPIVFFASLLAPTLVTTRPEA